MKKKASSKKIKGPAKTQKAVPDRRALRSYLQKVPHFVWKSPQAEVIAVGTAHISPQSLKDVNSVFKLYQPDAVAVELCQPRFEALMAPERWKHLDIAQIVKQRKLWLLCSSLILSAFQKKIAEGSAIEPGMEMKAAIRLAQKNHRDIILADREIRITLSRVWARVGFFSRLWLGSFLLTSLLIADEIEAEDVEKLKSRDVLEDFLSTLPKRYALLKEVILDERDLCIAEYIRQNLSTPKKPLPAAKKKRQARASKTPRRILAVLGAAHLDGVERSLKQKKPVELGALLTMPRRRLFKNIFSWIIFGAALLGISAIFFQRDFNPEILQELALTWVLSRSIGAGLGALIAWPSLATFLLTTLFAPVSYFFGLIGVRLWMVSALTELRFRKPRVEDFENISTDTATIRSFVASLYRNRMLHLLFLVLSVSLGLTVGNVFFFTDIFKALF